MYPITPIRLLRGHSSLTATTGSGCAMDVASYLNGDEKITDSPKCVSYVFRALFRELNDSMLDLHRHRLIPYVLRAMQTGSASKHQQKVWLEHLKSLSRHLNQYYEFDWMHKTVASFGKRATAFLVAMQFEWGHKYCSDQQRIDLENYVISWLDRVLPPLDNAYMTPEIKARAEKFRFPTYA